MTDGMWRVVDAKRTAHSVPKASQPHREDFGGQKMDRSCVVLGQMQLQLGQLIRYTVQRRYGLQRFRIG